MIGIVLFGEDERKNAKCYQAWLVINSAQGKIGEGGRIAVIQDCVAQG